MPPHVVDRQHVNGNEVDGDSKPCPPSSVTASVTTAAMESRVRGETFQGHWAQLRGIAAMQG